VRLLTVAQFADRFSISRAMVYKLMGAGAIRSVTIGTARRISIDEASRFEQSLTGGDAR